MSERNGRSWPERSDRGRKVNGHDRRVVDVNGRPAKPSEAARITGPVGGLNGTPVPYTNLNGADHGTDDREVTDAFGRPLRQLGAPTDKVDRYGRPYGAFGPDGLPLPPPPPGLPVGTAGAESGRRAVMEGWPAVDRSDPARHDRQEQPADERRAQPLGRPVLDRSLPPPPDPDPHQWDGYPPAEARRLPTPPMPWERDARGEPAAPPVNGFDDFGARARYDDRPPPPSPSWDDPGYGHEYEYGEGYGQGLNGDADPGYHEAADGAWGFAGAPADPGYGDWADPGTAPWQPGAAGPAWYPDDEQQTSGFDFDAWPAPGTPTTDAGPFAHLPPPPAAAGYPPAAEPEETYEYDPSGEYPVNGYGEDRGYREDRRYADYEAYGYEEPGPPAPTYADPAERYGYDQPGGAPGYDEYAGYDQPGPADRAPGYDDYAAYDQPGPADPAPGYDDYAAYDQPGPADPAPGYDDYPGYDDPYRYDPPSGPQPAVGYADPYRYDEPDAPAADPYGYDYDEPPPAEQATFLHDAPPAAPAAPADPYGHLPSPPVPEPRTRRAPLPVDSQPAQILDRGYRSYDGPRRGRVAAMRSVYRESLRKALGLKRGATAKAFPVFAGFLAYLPAIVFVGMVAVMKEPNPEELGRFIDQYMPSYGFYYLYIMFAIVVFVAFVTPEVLCTDRRNGLLPLYLASPLDRVRYLIAKAFAVAIAMSVVTVGPLMVFLLGRTINGDGPKGPAEFGLMIARILAAGVIITLPFLSLSFAVSSTTTRRADASAGIVFLLSTAWIVPFNLMKVAGIHPNILVFDLVQLPMELVSRLYAAGTTDRPLSIDWRQVPTPTLVAGYCAWIVAFSLFALYRYRRIQVTR